MPVITEASVELPPEFWWNSSLAEGVSRPSLQISVATAATPVTPVLERRITLASTVRPCMSMPGAPPRIRSMRSTWEAGMRCRIEPRSSCLAVGRSPSISTLPAAPAKPRTCGPGSKAKPGRRLIMSSAVVGRIAVKNAAG